MQKDNPINEALKSLRTARFELVNKLKDIDKAIQSLSDSMAAINSNNQSEYDSDWTIVNKFIFILKRENRFIHFREAAELIVEMDGKGDAKDIAGKITTNTTQLKKDKKIVKVQASKQLQDTFWGLPIWLDEHGAILNGHQYNTKYLYGGGNKKSSLFEL